jgi:hypothetical protein
MSSLNNLIDKNAVSKNTNSTPVLKSPLPITTFVPLTPGGATRTNPSTNTYNWSSGGGTGGSSSSSRSSGGSSGGSSISRYVDTNAVSREPTLQQPTPITPPKPIINRSSPIPLTTFVPLKPGQETRTSSGMLAPRPRPIINPAPARAPRIGDKMSVEMNNYTYARTLQGNRWVEDKELFRPQRDIPNLIAIGGVASLSLGGFGSIQQGVAPMIPKFTPSITSGFRPVQELAPPLTTAVKARVALRPVAQRVLSREGFAGATGISIFSPLIGEETALLGRGANTRDSYNQAVRETFAESPGGVQGYIGEVEGVGRMMARKEFRENLERIANERGLTGAQYDKAITQGMKAYDRGGQGEVAGALVGSSVAEILGQRLFAMRNAKTTQGKTFTPGQARVQVMKDAFPSIGVAGSYEAFTGSVRQQLSRNREVDFRTTAVDTASGSIFAGIIGTGVATAGVPGEWAIRKATTSGSKVARPQAGRLGLWSVYAMDWFEAPGDIIGGTTLKTAGIREPSINIRTMVPTTTGTTTSSPNTKVGTGSVRPTSVSEILGIAPYKGTTNTPTNTPNIVFNPTTPMAPTPTPTSSPVSQPTTRGSTTTPAPIPAYTPTTNPTNTPTQTPTNTPTNTPTSILTTLPIVTPTPVRFNPIIPPFFPPVDLGSLGGRNVRRGRTGFVNELSYGLNIFKRQNMSYNLGALSSITPRRPTTQIKTSKTRPRSKSRTKKKKKEEDKFNVKNPKFFLRGLI